ncbi:hypothetical protein [Algihabitans albus]|uniref:hypothetical protein n=1 Tax=Algihabitans albus TaxID=2164067 RepID=UPI000E5D4E19|nr:hypothetical protein [Algihabitans albus]
MRTHVFSAALIAALAAPSVLQAQDITPIADLQRGTMATVAGTVERLLDEDEFRLADESGSIAVYVGPNWVPADVGEAVTVEGFVDDGLIKEFYARELTRADGSVVTFERRYD